MANKRMAVDKGVPLPPPRIKQGVNVVTLAEMEEGDSIHWPPGEEKKSLRFYRVAKKLGVKIEIHQVGTEDPSGPGVRMWKMGNSHGEE